MNKRRISIAALVIAFGIGVLRVPILQAVTASYTSTIRIVDSAGNVINGIASAVTASYNSTVRVVDSTNHVLDSIGTNGGPSGLFYTGTGAEGAKTITGVVKVDGYHEYTTLDIHGAGQLQVDLHEWVFIRAQSCNIATTTATCVIADGTTDSNCAIDGTGINPNFALFNFGEYGGSSGGGGWDAATGGPLGAGQESDPPLTLNGVTGSSTQVGFTPLIAGGAAAVDNTHPGSNGSAYSASAAAGLLSMIGNLRGLDGDGSSPQVGPGGADTGGGFANGGGVVVLICGALTASTGHIRADGVKGIDFNNAGNCALNHGGLNGSGGGFLVVAAPGGYTSANMTANGGIGGAACAAGSTAGGAGGKGPIFNCNTLTGACSAL